MEIAPAVAVRGGGLHPPYAHARLFRGGIYDAWLRQSASAADQSFAQPEIAKIRPKTVGKGAPHRSEPARSTGSG